MCMLVMVEITFFLLAYIFHPRSSYFRGTTYQQRFGWIFLWRPHFSPYSLFQNCYLLFCKDKLKNRQLFGLLNISIDGNHRLIFIALWYIVQRNFLVHHSFFHIYFMIPDLVIFLLISKLVNLPIEQRPTNPTTVLSHLD